MALTERTLGGMGWRPDLPDHRDSLFQSPKGLVSTAIPEFRIVPGVDKLPVLDQLNTSSCVGHSVSEMATIVLRTTQRSRLELYYEARRLIGETEVDNGAYIRDAIRVLANLGVGRESYWPFDAGKVCIDPPEKVDRDGEKYKVIKYNRLITGDDYRHCLIQGAPFVIGFTCYDSFTGGDKVSKYGILNLPTATEKMRGGHAVMVVGYHNNFPNSKWAKSAVSAGFPLAEVPKKVYIIRNSWGSDWGNKGNFAIDADYLENDNLADDAWTIRRT